MMKRKKAMDEDNCVETVCFDGPTAAEPMNELVGGACVPQQGIPADIGNRNIYDIHIEGLNYGYLVRVGCQSAAIETREKLVRWLDAYLTDPAGVMENWFKGVRPE